MKGDALLQDKHGKPRPERPKRAQFRRSEERENRSEGSGERARRAGVERSNKRTPFTDISSELASASRSGAGYESGRRGKRLRSPATGSVEQANRLHALEDDTDSATTKRALGDERIFANLARYSQSSGNLLMRRQRTQQRGRRQSVVLENISQRMAELNASQDHENSASACSGDGATPQRRRRARRATTGVHSKCMRAHARVLWCLWL